MGPRNHTAHNLEICSEVMDLTPFAGTVGGGFFIGFITGYAIKKVMKLAAVIVDLFIAALAYMEYQRIINVMILILFWYVSNSLMLRHLSTPDDVTACLITRSWISEKRSSMLSGIDLYRQIGVIGISDFCIASCHPLSILIASSYFPCSISLPGNVPMTFNPHFDFSFTTSLMLRNCLNKGSTG